jgi:glycerol-3-phosphate responsive antiterminator
MTKTPGNTGQATTITQDQKKKLFAVLRMFLIERNQQRDKVEAIEKVLERNPELAPHYVRALAEVQRDPRPSVDIDAALEELRGSLFS